VRRPGPLGLWASFAACFALAACSGDAAPDVSTVGRPIFGGTPVADGQWANVVAVNPCTGVLLAPSLVAFAAHCGTDISEVLFGNDVATPILRVSTERCVAHPDASLGNGRDIAFCTLAEPVTGIAPLEIFATKDAVALEPGIPITQVGFGLDTDEGVFGVKRETTGMLATLGDDFVVQGTTGGTCAGDSGGPALVRLDAIDAGRPDEWRVLGLLSAGTSYECEVSTDHYTSLDAVVDWLESTSGTKLSSDASIAPPPSASGSVGCQVSPLRPKAPAATDAFAAAAVALLCRRKRGTSAS
jgi:hypothetical protein